MAPVLTGSGGPRFPASICRPFADLNSNALNNRDGPEVWYTDAFGRNGRTRPFPGSIRQRLAKMDNEIGVRAGGPVIGSNGGYRGAGVHAPN